MIYGKVLQELDKAELEAYSRLKDDFITRISDERYILKTIVEYQNNIIEGYGRLFGQTEKTMMAARRLREYEEKMEEKYKAVMLSDKVYSEPVNKCSD